MDKFLQKILNSICKNFSDDPAKMLIWTGVIGWAVSAAAQIFSIVTNKEISNEKKSFLIPQELADAAVNIGLFFILTQSIKKYTAKLFSTGKILPKSVREYINKIPDLKSKIGKSGLNLESKLESTPVYNNYKVYSNFGTTLATVGAGIVSTNILTPIIRNQMASNAQKTYIDRHSTAYPNSNTGMKI